MVVVLYPVVFGRKIILYCASFNPIGQIALFCRKSGRAFFYKADLSYARHKANNSQREIKT